MKSININNSNKGQRIDKFVLKLLPGLSKSFCYKMFRKKNIKLNGKRIQGNEILREGDRIEVFFSDDTYAKFAGEAAGEEGESGVGRGMHSSGPIQGDREIPLPDKIFENDSVLVINKKTGIFSQNDPSGISVAQQIGAYYDSNGIRLAEGVRVGVSNRLDRNTTGIVLSGKTMPVIQAMNEAIKERKVQKLYRTIVSGILAEPVTLKGTLKKDGQDNRVSVGNQTEAGVAIHTEVRPVHLSEGYTEVEVELMTGKTHQIRAHLASIGHPVIGDAKYGDLEVNARMKKVYGLHHQLLHAYRYVFRDRHMAEILGVGEFEAPLPELYVRIQKDLFGI